MVYKELDPLKDYDMQAAQRLQDTIHRAHRKMYASLAYDIALRSTDTKKPNYTADDIDKLLENAMKNDLKKDKKKC